MTHYFLGKAANYQGKTAHHFFARGNKTDFNNLKGYLAGRYDSSINQIALTANGRSALCLALKSLVPENSEVVMAGFSCYAVIQAIRGAHCTPIFADVTLESLNYTPQTLRALLKSHPHTKAIIVQNSFGNTVEIQDFIAIAKQHKLVIIEDLAHCAGQKYPDGTEVGTIGDAAALSFGKGKSLDTITGGALILRKTPLSPLRAPEKRPTFASYNRARWYPVFGKTMRGLSYLRLDGVFTRILLKFHWIERSADSPLDLEHRLAYFQAKLVLEQLEKMPKHPPKIRTFYFVKNRTQTLNKLSKQGFFFDEFWYETPIAPQRYFKKSGFDIQACPNALIASQQIINLPSHYSQKTLAPALKIIQEEKE